MNFPRQFSAPIFFAAWLACIAACTAATGPATDAYVANAQLIVRVEAAKDDVVNGRQRVAVTELLKGVDSAKTLLLAAGSVKPGKSALVLFPFKPPADSEPAVQTARTFLPPPRVWAIDDGMVHAEGATVPLDAVAKAIATRSPEEIGLNAQVADALHSPEKFAALAAKDPQRAKYVEFVIALRGLNRKADAKAPPRWPQPV
ncbi:MAG: hypothetical protein ACREKL_11110, partial [Chthoniobacterales bacterium]